MGRARADELRGRRAYRFIPRVHACSVARRRVSARTRYCVSVRARPPPPVSRYPVALPRTGHGAANVVAQKLLMLMPQYAPRGGTVYGVANVRSWNG